MTKPQKMYEYVLNRIDTLNKQIFEADEKGEPYKYLQDELTILMHLVAMVED